MFFVLENQFKKQYDLYEMVKTAKTILPDYLLYVKPEYMEHILRYLRNKCSIQADVYYERHYTWIT